MDSTQRELWSKLEAFEFDTPGSVLTFTRRLARENRWTEPRARRVVAEYRRFLFLAVAAGHAVSPAEDVDQAWHLHLTYTENYWQELCANVLGKRLHHRPTRGGPEEAKKFDGMYAQTLASYRRLFGAEPPADIWVPVGQKKHGGPQTHRWVDAATHWIFPKSWLVPSIAVAALVLIGLVVPGCASQTLNVLDLSGPEFLFFYICFSALCLGAAWFTHRHLCVPQGTAALTVLPTDPYELAYLAGGTPRMLHTALVNLHAAQAVVIDNQGECLVTRDPQIPSGLHKVEQLVWGGISPSGQTPARLLKNKIAPEAEVIAERLQAAGFLSTESERAATIALAVALVAPLIGLIKFFVGLERHRPVGFLAILLVGSVFVVIAQFRRLKKMRRSGLGDSALRAAKKIHVEDRVGTSASIGLATALFGLAILPQLDLPNLKSKLTDRGIGGDGGSGCGSSCGSGCGGGGGGCGSGCGGCGGH